MNQEQLNTYIGQVVDAAAEEIFEKAHGAAMTTSGDITPEQQERLDNTKQQLKKLVQEQVEMNLQLEDTEEAPMKEWNVAVLRTGYSHTMMAVKARTEQEAIDLALDEAGGESFSEKSSNYEALDGAVEIK